MELMLELSLYPLVHASYRSVYQVVISAFIEHWYPEANTFHMPFGEQTITLDDVYTLLRIPMIRTPIQVEPTRLSSKQAKTLLIETLGVMVEEAREALDKARGQAVRMEWLRLRLSGVTDAWNDDHIRYDVRGYLLYILGCTLFINKMCTQVPICFLTLLRDLDKVHTYAWGARALAYLYHQLGITNQIDVKQMIGYVMLLEG